MNDIEYADSAVQEHDRLLALLAHAEKGENAQRFGALAETVRASRALLHEHLVVLAEGDKSGRRGVAAQHDAVRHGEPTDRLIAEEVAVDGDDRVVLLGEGAGRTEPVRPLRRAHSQTRLAEIDAPELDQPYGGKAKQALADLVFGQVVSILPAATDRYGRTVGRVYREGQDVNLALVHAGAHGLSLNTRRTLYSRRPKRRRDQHRSDCGRYRPTKSCRPGNGGVRYPR